MNKLAKAPHEPKNKALMIDSYHQRASHLFHYHYPMTLQAPFILTNAQHRQLLRSVKIYYDFLVKKHRPRGLFLARPEFIFDGNFFRLIDLNVSNSISSFSYTSCLRYFQNHPSNMLAKLDIAGGDFDHGLSIALKDFCQKKRVRSILILDDHSNSASSYFEPILHTCRLQSQGLSIKIANLRHCNLRITKNEILFNGETFQAAMLGFPPKHGQDYQWLSKHITKLNKLGLLVSDPNKDFLMMSKSNLIDFYAADKSGNYSLEALSLSDYLSQEHNVKHTQKNQWVLKEVQGYGSEQVFFGKNYDTPTWKKMLMEKGDRSQWILQRHLTSKVYRMPVIHQGKVRFQQFSPVFSPFVINGKVSGILVKAYTKYELKQIAVPGIALSPK